LKKINDRIDNKIARRQQQQSTKESVPVQSPPTTTFNIPPPIVHTTIPSFNNDEYSIFRDLPASRPTTTTVCSCSMKKNYYLFLISLNNNQEH